MIKIGRYFLTVIALGVCVEGCTGTAVQQEAYETSRDSLLTVLQSIKADNGYEKSSVFKYGFARVQTEDATFYIDRSGNVSFDKIISIYHPIKKINLNPSARKPVERDNCTMMLKVKKEGKLGLISSEAGWVLPAQYTNIPDGFNGMLTKNGKQGYADTWGNIKVPAKFDKIKVIGNENYGISTNGYYAIKNGDKWGVYSAQEKQLIIPAKYDKLDYCGGCENTVDYVYAKQNGKWGVVGFDGTVMVPFIYDGYDHYKKRSDNWVTSFKKDGKKIVINMAIDKVYSPPKYNDMVIISGVLAAKKDGKYGLINARGKQITPFIYSDVVACNKCHSGRFIQVCKGEACGIVNTEGEVIVSPDIYDYFDIEDGFFWGHTDDGTALLNYSGALLLPAKYKIPDLFNPRKIKDNRGRPVSLFQIKQDKLTGFFNARTQTVVEPKFTEIHVTITPDSTRYYTKVEIRGRGKGLYSLKGKELIPPKYEYIEFLTADIILFEKEGGGYGLISLKSGEVIIPPKYETIKSVSDRYFYLKDNNGSGTFMKIWDAKAQKFLDMPYPRIRLAGWKLQQRLIVYDTTQAYLYSLQKREIISQSYDVYRSESVFPGFDFYVGIRDFEHGLAKVYKNGKYGYINTQGKEVIPTKYDKTDMDQRGIIKLSKKIKDGLWKYGYADSTGTMLTPIKYSMYDGDTYIVSSSPKSDYLKISTYNKQLGKNLFGMITRDGKVVVPPKYDKVHPFRNEKGFLVKSNMGWGLLDEAGKMLVPPVLDKVDFNKVSPDRYTKSMQYPVRGKLDAHYFYVTHSGKILPFSGTEKMRFRNRRRRR